MKRYPQNLEDLRSSLSKIEVDWKDENARRLISFLEGISASSLSLKSKLKENFEHDFKSSLLICRLILGLSKDEFILDFKAYQADNISPGSKLFKSNQSEFLATLNKMGFQKELESLLSTNYTWKDILVERLRGGRGSAIKGQVRGRYLEDWTEEILLEFFSSDQIETRCNFTGQDGTTQAKSDFAIPNSSNPTIIIECKAYGATGSKQTDVLGDIEKIINVKRHDTLFLLVTDGISWNLRLSDLKKIVDQQNKGFINRIYTQKMRSELIEDLKSLKSRL